MMSIAPTARLAWPVRNRRTAKPVPTRCQKTTAAHDLGPIKVYVRVTPGKREAVALCRGCFEVYAGMGLAMWLADERR